MVITSRGAPLLQHTLPRLSVCVLIQKPTVGHRSSFYCMFNCCLMPHSLAARVIGWVSACVFYPCVPLPPLGYCLPAGGARGCAACSQGSPGSSRQGCCVSARAALSCTPGIHTAHGDGQGETGTIHIKYISLLYYHFLSLLSSYGYAVYVMCVCMRPGMGCIKRAYVCNVTTVMMHNGLCFCHVVSIQLHVQALGFAGKLCVYRRRQRLCVTFFSDSTPVLLAPTYVQTTPRHPYQSPQTKFV